MSGKNNKFTVMIIPHSEKHTVRLNIPMYVLQIMAVILIISIILFFLGLKSYINLKKENEMLISSRLELEAVKNKLNTVAYRVSDMESSVSQLEFLENQIREQNGLEQSITFFDDKNKRVVMASRSATAKNPPDTTTLIADETEKKLDLMEEAVPVREESAKELISQVEEKKKRLAATPSIYPTIGRITSHYGYRRDPFHGRISFHDGIDFANSYNTPVYSAAEGTVLSAQVRSGYGRQIKIYHGYGISTSYSHLARMIVSPGDKVKKGQLIGYMGSSGRSTGTHLHYMVYENGSTVNPVKYLPR